MLSLLFIIIGVLLIAIGGFYTAIFVVRLWTGCTKKDAVKRIRDAVNGTVHIPLEQDPGLWSEIWAAIRNIIGEARFDKLRRIYESLASSQGGITLCGHHSGLLYIVIILDQLTDAERKLIEAVVVGIVKRHLRIRGLPDLVIVTWGEYDNGLVYLEIRFGETEEQQGIVRAVLADELRQQQQTDDEDPLFR